MVYFFIDGLIFGVSSLRDESRSPWKSVVDNLINATCITLLSIYFVKKIYASTLREIGFVSGKSKQDILAGVIAGIGLWLIASLIDLGIETLFGGGPDHPALQTLQRADTTLSYFALVTGIVLISPIAEEIFFRGFTLTVFSKRYGHLMGILMTSMLFSLTHISPWWLLQIFAIGVGLAILREYTGSLLSSVIAHVEINLIVILTSKM